MKEQFHDAKNGVKEQMLERQRKDYSNNTGAIFDEGLEAKTDEFHDAIEYEDETQRQREEEKIQRMAAKGKADMDAYVGNTKKLADQFLAAKTSGTQDYTGTTGDKQLEKRIAEGQRLNVLRVLPPGLKKYPSHITELSDDKAAIERHRQHLGLSKAASSSSGPVKFDISSPRDRPKKPKPKRQPTPEQIAIAKLIPERRVPQQNK